MPKSKGPWRVTEAYGPRLPGAKVGDTPGLEHFAKAGLALQMKQSSGVKYIIARSMVSGGPYGPYRSIILFRDEDA